ncbi:hypothetical protein WJX75_004673 [Coccomyxa subellipsoidea]|uniref:Caleosin-domain-containing protein n=1 Tax=Coccomyxa subellipsoidea TaxID=248742 RepID=A0ABR2Z3I7_9CHLO
MVDQKNGPLFTDGVQTGVAEVPVTLKGAPENFGSKMPNPGLARATKAVSAEKPSGTSSSPKDRTVLQQHVDFFDFDKDGILYPQDTFNGFHKIGFNVFLSAFAVLVIHGTFSYPSQEGWLPDPFFSVKINNIHKCKHGSDSESYDTEGRFVPEKAEELFAKYDKEKKGGLYYRDILTMINGNRNIFDPVGWTAEFLEWSALWLIAADDKGFLPKEAVRAQFDGSLFYQLARKNEAKKAAAKRDTSKVH